MECLSPKIFAGPGKVGKEVLGATLDGAQLAAARQVDLDTDWNPNLDLDANFNLFTGDQDSFASYNGFGLSEPSLHFDLFESDVIEGYDYDVWVGGLVADSNSLPYDVSKWGDYGLPSDGTFVRTLTPQQYRDFKAGRDFDFAGGKFPDEGYPDGMGFIGSAEEVRHIDTVAGYKEALKLDYDPKIIMEFQLKDPGRLQNVLDAPFDEFVRGGKTGAGYLEWNYLGINSSDIINPTIRELK